MKITRRDTLVMAGAAGGTVMFMPFLAQAAEVDAIIEGFTGGAEVVEGGVDLTTPEIAENGNTVPVEAAAEGAPRIMMIAAGNPEGNVMTANFTEGTPSRISTRIRLAGTQDVIAIAEMPDGSFARASKEVKVTIGGCGG